MPYPVLAKDPSALRGTCVSGQAQVFQFDSATGTSNLLMDVKNLGYGSWTNEVWVQLHSPSVGSGKLSVRFLGGVGGGEGPGLVMSTF